MEARKLGAPKWHHITSHGFGYTCHRSVGLQGQTKKGCLFYLRENCPFLLAFRGRSLGRFGDRRSCDFQPRHCFCVQLVYSCGNAAHILLSGLNPHLNCFIKMIVNKWLLFHLLRIWSPNPSHDLKSSWTFTLTSISCKITGLNTPDNKRSVFILT